MAEMSEHLAAVRSHTPHDWREGSFEDNCQSAAQQKTSIYLDRAASDGSGQEQRLSFHGFLPLFVPDRGEMNMMMKMMMMTTTTTMMTITTMKVDSLSRREKELDK